jgi:uncharacterized protein (DUF2147 family)
VSAQPESQPATFLGDWQEPGGSVVRIEHCGSDLCMSIRVLSPKAPSITDTHNPDLALRSRALCGLRIGTGFRIDDATHASHGQLYDPKSGNTYHGMMTLDGNALKLRGYVGISLLSRTEVWRSVQPVNDPCHASK